MDDQMKNGLSKFIETKSLHHETHPYARIDHIFI